MKRAIALILLTAILLSIPACGGASETDTPTGTAAETETETEADIFEGLKTTAYNGKTFKWMVPDSDDYRGDLWTESENGESYNDAIYQRNLLVQERFNITIKAMVEPYTWDIRNEYTGKIRASVQSNDNYYDLVSSHSFILPPLAVDGVLLDLNSVESIRFDRPWWSQLAYKALTFADKVYFMSGDISVNILEFANVLFMNKELAKSYKLEVPYDLVKEGKWTQDKLETMIKGTASDLNGDGVMDGNDMYGYIFHDASSIYNVPISFGVTLGRREGDTIVFNLDSEDAVFGAEYNKKFLTDNPDTHCARSDRRNGNSDIHAEPRDILRASAHASQFFPRDGS